MTEILEFFRDNYILHNPYPIDDIDKVSKTIDAYYSIVKIISGSSFIKSKMPQKGTKLWSNCRTFYEIAEMQKKSIKTLIDTSISRFSADWCMETFKRPYPPISVVTSEKSLINLIRLNSHE